MRSVLAWFTVRGASFLTAGIVGLLAARGHDTTDTRIALFAGGGFSPELRARARADRLILVDLERLYRGE